MGIGIKRKSYQEKKSLEIKRIKKHIMQTIGKKEDPTEFDSLVLKHADAFADWQYRVRHKYADKQLHVPKRMSQEIAFESFHKLANAMCKGQIDAHGNRIKKPRGRRYAKIPFHGPSYGEEDL